MIFLTIGRHALNLWSAVAGAKIRKQVKRARRCASRRNWDDALAHVDKARRLTEEAIKTNESIARGSREYAHDMEYLLGLIDILEFVGMNAQIASLSGEEEE